MIKNHKHIILIWTMFLCCFGSVLAQQSQPELTRILFVLDGSASMKDKWKGSNKIGAAKTILKKMVDSLNTMPDLQMALRIYGHNSNFAYKDCRDTRLEVAFNFDNKDNIYKKLDELKPNGITPISYSLEQSATDFSDRPAKNIILLLTDGNESCDGDPCEVAKALESKRIDLKTFVIGIGLRDAELSGFDCFDNFFNATDPKTLDFLLNAVIKKVIAQSTIQVNLNDKNGNPTITNVNMSFQDRFSKQNIYQFYHALDENNRPDTMSVDPFRNYNLKIQTTPPILVENIQIKDNKHSVINIKCPLGTLQTKLTKKSTNQKTVKILLKESNSDETLEVIELGEKIRLLEGNYDLEVLTLPRITLKNVKITEKSIKNIEIKPSGRVLFSSRFPIYGGIFLADSKNPEKIHSLNEKGFKETLDLQPGKYKLIYRTKFQFRMKGTETKVFEVKSGQTINLNP